MTTRRKRTPKPDPELTDMVVAREGDGLSAINTDHLKQEIAWQELHVARLRDMLKAEEAVLEAMKNNLARPERQAADKDVA